MATVQGNILCLSSQHSNRCTNVAPSTSCLTKPRFKHDLHLLSALLHLSGTSSQNAGIYPRGFDMDSKEPHWQLHGTYSSKVDPLWRSQTSTMAEDVAYPHVGAAPWLNMSHHMGTQRWTSADFQALRPSCANWLWMRWTAPQGWSRTIGAKEIQGLQKSSPNSWHLWTPSWRISLASSKDHASLKYLWQAKTPCVISNSLYALERRKSENHPMNCYINFELLKLWYHLFTIREEINLTWTVVL